MKLINNLIREKNNIKICDMFLILSEKIIIRGNRLIGERIQNKTRKIS